MSDQIFDQLRGLEERFAQMHRRAQRAESENARLTKTVYSEQLLRAFLDGALIMRLQNSELETWCTQRHGRIVIANFLAKKAAAGGKGFYAAAWDHRAGEQYTSGVLRRWNTIDEVIDGLNGKPLPTITALAIVSLEGGPISWFISTVGSSIPANTHAVYKNFAYFGIHCKMEYDASIGKEVLRLRLMTDQEKQHWGVK